MTGTASGRRGSVLANVLVAVIIVGMISALLMRLAFQPAVSAARSLDSLSKSKQDEASINKVWEAWGAQGATCASDASVGVSCLGTGCTCRCSVAGLPPVSASGPAGGPCSVSATAP